MRKIRTLLAIIFVLTLLPSLCLAKEPLPDYDLEPVVPVEFDKHETSIKLSIDKKEIYGDVIDLLKMAQKEILLNIYLFGGDDNIYAESDDYIGIGKHMIDIMADKIEEAQARGEEFTVRIITPKPSEMIDKQKKILGTIKRVRSRLRKVLRMSELPPPIEPPYEPVFDYAVEKGIPILPSNTDVMASETGASWRLDHSKLLIIDGKEALIGGMNFAETVASNHDAMTRITGTVVTELKAIFTNAWYYAVQQSQHRGLDVPEDWKDYRKLSQTSSADIDENHEKRLQEGWEKGTIQLTLSAPYARNSRKATVDLLDSTGEGDSIMVEMLLMTDVPCIEALIRAHERGVNVRVILDPNHSLYGVNCHGAPNIIAVKPFLEAKLPVRNFTPKDGGQELHMKLVIVKRTNGSMEFAMGSTNWTYGAFESNFEMFPIFSDCPETCTRLVETFEADWETRTHLPGREVTSTGFLGLKPLSEEERFREINLLQKFLFAFLEERHEKWF